MTQFILVFPGEEMFGIIDWAAEERFALEQAEATPRAC